MSRFLACPEYIPNRGKDSFFVPAGLSVQINDTLEDNAITFHDALFSWSNGSDGKNNFSLDVVNLCFPKGSFVVVIGEVIAHMRCDIVHFSPVFCITFHNWKNKVIFLDGGPLFK